MRTPYAAVAMTCERYYHGLGDLVAPLQLGRQHGNVLFALQVSMECPQYFTDCSTTSRARLSRVNTSHSIYCSGQFNRLPASVCALKPFSSRTARPSSFPLRLQIHWATPTSGAGIPLCSRVRTREAREWARGPSRRLRAGSL